MKKQSGFALFNLIIAMVFISGILLGIYKTIHYFYKKNEYKKVVGQIHAMENETIQYISENYLELMEDTDSKINSDEIIVTDIRGIIDESSQSFYTDHYQQGCVFISQVDTPNHNESNLNVYLLLSAQPKYAPSDKDNNEIIKKLGSNAGIVVNPVDEELNIKSKYFNNFTFTDNELDEITENCYSWGLSTGSIIIDLSSNPKLMNQIKMVNTNDGDEPTISRTDVELKSDIYFDNVVENATDTTESLHVYRGFDLGVGYVDGEEKRIRIRNDERIARTNDNNTLLIENAGIQAGKITFDSENITTGTICRADERGKTVQQPYVETYLDPENYDPDHPELSTPLIGGDLICTYNRVFCPDEGYCYMPQRVITLDYTFKNRTNSHRCQSVMILHPTQNTALDMSIPCPEFSGQHVTQGLHLQKDECYVFEDMSYCKKLTAVCSYASNSNPKNVFDEEVPALQRVRCTNNFNIRVIENYKYPNPEELNRLHELDPREPYYVFKNKESDGRRSDGYNY